MTFIATKHIEYRFGKDRTGISAKDIVDIYDRELREINGRINLDRIRFKDGIDIMDLKGTRFDNGLIDNRIYTQNAVNRSRNIYILSEKVYVKLLKILQDDFAWISVKN